MTRPARRLWNAAKAAVAPPARDEPPATPPGDAATAAQLRPLWRPFPRAGVEDAVADGKALIARGRVADGVAALREAWWSGGERGAAVAVTLAASQADPEFQALVEDADTARDARLWPAAEQGYAAALRLYPLHGGYRVQLAHMLKEQERFTAAEIAYRDALALGAPRDDVQQHLAFVCDRQGVSAEPVDAPSLFAPWLRTAPTADDVRTLAAVIWRDEPSEAELAGLLRAGPTVEAVVVLMLKDPRAAARNRKFLALLAERL